MFIFQLILSCGLIISKLVWKFGNLLLLQFRWLISVAELKTYAKPRVNTKIAHNKLRPDEPGKSEILRLYNWCMS